LQPPTASKALGLGRQCETHDCGEDPCGHVGCVHRLDVLLTPPAGLETRDPAKVTGLGYAVLGLLFIGLALGIVALVLLFQTSRRALTVAIVAGLLYLPVFLSEQAGRFSALRPPAAIQAVEWVQAIIAVIVIGLSPNPTPAPLEAWSPCSDDGQPERELAANGSR